MAYVDLEDFLAAKLPAVKKDEEKAAISAVLAAASNYVDKATGRAAGFYAVSPADPSTRRFRGDGSKVLRIPAHIKGTVSVENVPLAAWYESEQNGWLYKYSTSESENFLPQFDGYPVWTKGGLYNVAARWGFAATPADITEAVSQIALRWWQNQQGTLGQITPTGFVIERDVPPSAQAILDTWIKGEFDL